MRTIRAQVTTRSGPMGAKDAQPLVHGEFEFTGQASSREFRQVLVDCLEAARGVARDGMVTEVAVLVYPDMLRNQG